MWIQANNGGPLVNSDRLSAITMEEVYSYDARQSSGIVGHFENETTVRLGTYHSSRMCRIAFMDLISAMKRPEQIYYRIREDDPEIDDLEPFKYTE